MEPNNTPLPEAKPEQTPEGALPPSNPKSLMVLSILALVALALILAAIVLYQHSHKPAANPTTKSLASATVMITPSGFVPSTLLVRPGTVVTWENQTTTKAQVSSNPYPTHSALPSLYSTVIAPGETYSYTFSKTGTWGYDNYLHPTTSGTVNVR